MTRRKTIGFVSLILFSQIGFTQSDSLSFEQQLAQLEREMDSLSIFYMLDSILSESMEMYSELSPRISYNSNVLSFGRNYGLDQHGISPGVSFFHKSGVFLDYMGFWSNNLDPKYNLSIFSVGYLGAISNHISFTGSYERWAYHGNAEPNANQLQNSIGGSISFNSKIGYATLDYGYLFGEDNGAHRLIGSLTGSIQFDSWWIFDRVAILPSFSTYFGNQQVIIRYEGNIWDEIRTNEYLRQNLNAENLEPLLTPTEQQTIQNIIDRSDGQLTRLQKLRILNVYLSNEDVVDYVYDLLDEEKSQYGIMNYNLSLPISFTKDNFSFLLSYTYSFPIQLPDEPIELDPIGYFGASISYRIPFK